MKIICVSEYWQLLTLNVPMFRKWNFLLLRVGNKFIHLINVNSHLKAEAEAATVGRGRGEEPASSVNYAQSHCNAEIIHCRHFTFEWINQPSHTHTRTHPHMHIWWIWERARCITLRRANVSATLGASMRVHVSFGPQFLYFALPNDFNAKIIWLYFMWAQGERICKCSRNTIDRHLIHLIDFHIGAVSECVFDNFLNIWI